MRAVGKLQQHEPTVVVTQKQLVEGEPGGEDTRRESLHSQSGSKRKCRPSRIHDPDNFLLYLGDTLEKLHAMFYSRYDEMAKSIDITAATDIPTPDLKKIIPQLRQSVIKGANILFTGVVPTNMPSERSPEWNTARAFGAKVHSRLIRGLDSSDPNKAKNATTHIIVGKPGTSKLKIARRIHGMRIVSPKWLWCCAERWSWADEREFPSDYEKCVIVQGSTSQRESLSSGSEIPKAKVLCISGDGSSGVQSGDRDPAVTTPQRRASLRVQETVEVKRITDLGGSRPLRRIVSQDSRLSVSDEEFDRMEAEVDAEISSSSSSSSAEMEREEERVGERGRGVAGEGEVGVAGEGEVGVAGEEEVGMAPEGGTEEVLGSLVQDVTSESLSCGQFEGGDDDVFVTALNRKRKHEDIEAESSSNSNSPSFGISLLDPNGGEDYESDSDDSGDELAAFLGGDNQSGAEADSESD